MTFLLVLQCGVFSPTSRNHYLNITPKNIVRIYSSASGSCSTISVNSFVADDFKIAPETPQNVAQEVRTQDSLFSATSSPFSTFGSTPRSAVAAPTSYNRPVSGVTVARASTSSRYFNPTSSQTRPSVPTPTLFKPRKPATPVVFQSRTFSHPKFSQSASKSQSSPQLNSSNSAVTSVPPSPSSSCFSVKQSY